MRELTILSPSTVQLHDDLAEELQLVPDVLSNALAELNVLMSNLPQQFGRKEQDLVAKLEELIPCIVQPHLLLIDGIRLVEQQKIQSDEQQTPTNSASPIRTGSRSSLGFGTSLTRATRGSLNSYSATSRASVISLKAPKIVTSEESLLEESIQILQLLLPDLTGKYFSEFVNPINCILNVYVDYLKKWKTADTADRENLLIPKVQVELKADKNNFYFTTQAFAQKIICRDSYGYLRKANASGNHAVDISSKLVKKGSLEEGERDPILPGMEKIVVSFCNLLGQKLIGEELAAPTTLIRLSQIRFQKIQPQLSDSKELEQFNLRQMEGRLPLELLVQHYPKVVFEPQDVGAFVQVGKTIHGWSLYDLLSLLQKFDQTLKKLGTPLFAENFEYFITGSYLDAFLQSNPDYAELLKPIVKQDPNYDVNLDNRLKKLFLGFGRLLDRVEPQHRFVEYKEFNFSKLIEPEYVLDFEFKKFMLRYSAEQQLSALAILSYWPALMIGEELADIFQLCKIFKKVPELFPGISAQEIFVQLPQLQNLFDADNYTAFIVANLLINPCDGKADNYMVEFVRNDQKKITAIKIKGIDNDQALAHVFVRSKNLVSKIDPLSGKVGVEVSEVHFTAVKSILYAMPQLHQPASRKVLSKLLHMFPEEFLLEWLEEQYRDDYSYCRMLKNGKLDSDIPLRFDFNSIFSIYSKLVQMQKMIASNLNITNYQLLSMIEPILALFYAKIVAQQQYPIPAMSRIYHGKGEAVPTVEEVLSSELDTLFIDEHKSNTWRSKLNTYTGTEHYAKTRTQTIEQVVEKFVKQINIRRFFQNETLLWLILRLLARFDFLVSLPLDKNELQNLLYFAIVKHEVEVVKLLVRCKEIDINFVYAQDYRTPLRLAVIQPNPSLEIIGALFQNKKININAFDRNGDTALTLADLNNIELIATLVKYGIDIDARQVTTGKTLIDLAVDQQRPDLFANLVAKGAGKNLNPKKAYNFIAGYIQQPAWQNVLSQTMNTLALQNSEFATFLTVEAITQIDNPGQNLLPIDMLTNEGIERRYIRADVVEKIFELENDQVKNVKRDNLYGRRNVAFVEHNGQKMHIKSHPEIFATEESVKLLWRMLFSQGGIAESIVFSFTDPKTRKAYPILVSRHVEGNNLQKVVQDLTLTKSLIELDAKRFSEVLIMTMLINPEDDKPDNKILRSFVNHEGITKLEIVGIDNDHAYVFPLLRKDGHRVLQVKSIVACLDQMKEPIHPTVKQVILNLSAKTLLETWLKSLIARQQCSDKLFSEQQRQEFFNDKNNPILTRMPLPKGIVAHMYDKLLKMQGVLQNQPYISQIDFFCKVEPSFIAYKYILEDSDNPGARFHELFHRQYSTVIANRFDTVITGKHILQSARIPDKDMIANNVTFGPEQALVELLTTAKEQDTLTNVKAQLRKGSIEPFKQLLLSSSHEAVLKEIVLKELEPGLRFSLLSALKDRALIALDLNGCVEVKTDLLKPILENSPNMLALNISGCEKIDNKILETIAENCPALEKLYINDLPWQTTLLRKDKPVYLQSLKKLLMNNNYNLKEFILKAPRLLQLALNNASNLVRINFQGQSLSSLSLQNSGQVNESDYLRLLSQSPDLLRSMQIKAEINLSARNIAWMNSAFGCQQWQADNVEKILVFKQLLLQRLSVSDTDLQNIIYYARHTEHINLVGTSFISWQGFAMLLNKSLALQSLKKTNYCLQPTIKSYNTGIIEAFAHGFEDQLLSVSRDKFFKIFNTASLDETGESITSDKPFSAICAVNGLAFTGAVDGTIKIWDIANRMPLQTIKAHATTVRALQYIANKNLLISGSDDRTIKFIDIYTGAIIKSISSRFKVTTLQLIDKLLIVGGDNGTVTIYKTINYEQINTFVAHQNPIFALRKISSNLVATGAGDYTTKIWDINSGKCISTLLGHTGPVSAIEVLQSGQLVATGSLDKTIKIWDMITSECLMTFTEHTRKITALTLVENKLISAAEDGCIKVLEFPINEILFDIPRNSKPFELTLLDSLIKLQVKPKLNIPLLKYCADFIVQTVGNSGIGINLDLNNGEIIFAINNKDKYVMVELILSQLNKFIGTASVVSLSSWMQTRKSSIRIGTTEDSKDLKPQFWRSAKPAFESEIQQKPRALSLQLRLAANNARSTQESYHGSEIADSATNFNLNL